MKIFKKIFILTLSPLFLLILCECSFFEISKDEIPENYYGEKYGYAEEYGDVEVIVREDGCYQVVDFSSMSKQNNVLIIPDYINGIPVKGVGLRYAYNPINYRNDELRYVDLLPDGSAIYGIKEYKKTNENIIQLFDTSDVPDYNCQYLYYLDYPQLNNTGNLNSLYISCYSINNVLPLLFMNFSENSKIVFNTTNMNPLYYDNHFTCEDIPNERYTYYAPFNSENCLLALCTIISRLDGSTTNLYNKETNKKLNIYKFNIETFNPKIIVNKVDYNYIINDYADYYKIIKSIVHPSNVSFKYNLNIDGKDYNNPKFDFKKVNDRIDSYNSRYNEYNEYLNDSNFVEFRKEKLIELIDFCSKGYDLFTKYLNEIESVLDNYWIDYCSDGELLMEPPIPYVEGYEFIGWYKDSECTEAWDFTIDKVSFENEDSELILYAKWRNA